MTQPRTDQVQVAATSLGPSNDTPSGSPRDVVHATSGPVKPNKPAAKRLQIACGACRNDKRKCDGTDPCSHCYYGQRECIYKDRKGKQVSAPVLPHPDLRYIAEKLKTRNSENGSLGSLVSGNRRSGTPRDVAWSYASPGGGSCCALARPPRKAPYPVTSPHIRHKLA